MKQLDVDSERDMKELTSMAKGTPVTIIVGSRKILGATSRCGDTNYCTRCVFNGRYSPVHKGFYSLCTYIDHVVLGESTKSLCAVVSIEEAVE